MPAKPHQGWRNGFAKARSLLPGCAEAMDVTSSDRFVGVERFLHIRSTGRFRKPGTLESNMRDVFPSCENFKSEKSQRTFTAADGEGRALHPQGWRVTQGLPSRLSRPVITTSLRTSL